MWFLVLGTLLDSETISCRQDELIAFLRTFPSSTKLSLQFPPGALHSSTSDMVPLDLFFWRPVGDFLVFLSMEVRISASKHRIEYSCWTACTSTSLPVSDVLPEV